MTIINGAQQNIVGINLFKYVFYWNIFLRKNIIIIINYTLFLGFDLAKYAEEIVNSFGPSSPYKDPNPKTKEEMPKKGIGTV